MTDERRAGSNRTRRLMLGGLALAATIVLYDRFHKNNPLSPLIMGLCRVLVYVSAALCLTAALPRELWVAALLVLCYLIGLTYIYGIGRVRSNLI